MRVSRRDFLEKFFRYLPIAAIGSIAFPFVRFLSFSNSFKKMKFTTSLNKLASKVTKFNDPPMFIIKSRTSKLLALDSHCTHMGCIVNYDPTRNIFLCPCHGSEYSITGINIRGPTKRPLNREPIKVINGEIVVEYIYYKIS